MPSKSLPSTCISSNITVSETHPWAGQGQSWHNGGGQTIGPFKMFEKFSYSNYYRVLATVPCHPCQNSFDEKLIICWNNFKYANFVILCPVNSLVSCPGHHLVLLRLQSSRSHPVHHLEKECKKRRTSWNPSSSIMVGRTQKRTRILGNFSPI